jgi:hypothetical protein
MPYRRFSRIAIAATAVTFVITSAAPSVAASSAATTAAASGHYTGSLADGATWVADVPTSWNGTIILYSHGFGPLAAQDAPDATTQADLLGLGYALVGSSYSGPSWWALASAAADQFASLAAAEQITGRPRRTIAWGTSMGGLVSAEETQDARGRIDGTLTTCGLVAGALSLNNYQLDGEYALNELLAPSQHIQLVTGTGSGSPGPARRPASGKPSSIRPGTAISSRPATSPPCARSSTGWTPGAGAP